MKLLLLGLLRKCLLKFIPQFNFVPWFYVSHSRRVTFFSVQCQWFQPDYIIVWCSAKKYDDFAAFGNPNYRARALDTSTTHQT